MLLFELKEFTTSPLYSTYLVLNLSFGNPIALLSSHVSQLHKLLVLLFVHKLLMTYIDRSGHSLGSALGLENRERGVSRRSGDALPEETV